jgi:hypothetical protein
MQWQQNQAVLEQLRQMTQPLTQLRLVMLHQLLLSLPWLQHVRQLVWMTAMVGLPLTPWLRWVWCCKLLLMLTPKGWQTWLTRWCWSSPRLLLQQLQLQR